MKTYGLDRFGELIAQQCALARALGERIAAAPGFELLAPVTLNIVCFRYAPHLEAAACDALNARLAVALAGARARRPVDHPHRRKTRPSA